MRKDKNAVRGFFVRGYAENLLLEKDNFEGSAELITKRFP